MFVPASPHWLLGQTGKTVALNRIPKAPKSRSTHLWNQTGGYRRWDETIWHTKGRWSEFKNARKGEEPVFVCIHFISQGTFTSYLRQKTHLSIPSTLSWWRLTSYPTSEGNTESMAGIPQPPCASAAGANEGNRNMSQAQLLIKRICLLSEQSPMWEAHMHTLGNTGSPSVWRWCAAPPAATSCSHGPRIMLDTGEKPSLSVCPYVRPSVRLSQIAVAHYDSAMFFRLPGTVQTDWLLIFKTADNEFKAHPLARAYLWKAQPGMIKEGDRHCVPWPGIIAEMKITCGCAEAKLAGFIKGSPSALRGAQRDWNLVCGIIMKKTGMWNDSCALSHTIYG